MIKPNILGSPDELGAWIYCDKGRIPPIEEDWYICSLHHKALGNCYTDYMYFDGVKWLCNGSSPPLDATVYAYIPIPEAAKVPEND